MPLILAWKNTLFLNDSDYFSSYIANYQKNLIQELVGNTGTHRIAVHCLNIVCAVFTLFALLIFFKLPSKYRNASLAIWTLLVFTLSYVSNNYNTKGDVRMVGKIRNSHENDGFDGVPKMINACGYPYIIGNKNAKILVVKNGEKAAWKGEKLVVAEPNAIIKILGHKVEIGEEPLGCVDGIIDARCIIVDGHAKGVTCEINGIQMIGTGSPAKIQWNRFLK